MSISIFAKEAFLNVNPGQPFKLRTKPVRSGHLLRVSSMIRGNQIAEQIGAKFNPESGYENDVCIYVKPYAPKGHDFNFEGKSPYLDIIDGHSYGELLFRYPNVSGIVCSQADYDIMSNIYDKKGKTIKNKIVLIPQHHCNFKRVKRTRKEVTVVGCIGTRYAFPFLPKDLKKELAKRKMELIEFSRFFTRQDIIDFYQKIDVQIVWRPYRKILSNPLKIVNASSFGVPTIALDETAFKELEGHYIPVKDFKEFLEQLDKLRSEPDMYQFYSEKCIDISEKYHIEKVGEMYKKLT